MLFYHKIVSLTLVHFSGSITHITELKIINGRMEKWVDFIICSPNLSQLTRLTLDNVGINESHVREIISNKTKLEELYVPNNWIDEIIEPESLQVPINLQNLKVLDLTNNKISPEGVKRIVELQKNDKRWGEVKITLVNNGFDDREKEMVKEYLHNNKSPGEADDGWLHSIWRWLSEHPVEVASIVSGVAITSVAFVYKDTICELIGEFLKNNSITDNA